MANTLRSSRGLVGDTLLICEYAEETTHGSILSGDDPLTCVTAALLFQIFIIFSVTRITHFLLSPLRQTTIISHIVAGIIMGPSVLGQQKVYYERLFPDSSKLALTVFGEFGIMIHFFKIGVQVDPKQIMSIRRKEQLIGFTGYILALAFGIVAYNIFHDYFANFQNKELQTGMASMVVLNSLTSCVVIGSFLSELNMLNSDIGRLALSTSMISDASAWVLAFIIVNFGRAVEFSSYKPVMEVLSLMCYYGSMFLLFRPLVIKIANRTPEGKPMAESHFVSIICILLFLAVLGQYIGQTPSFSAFIFGLSLPAGPPLGAVLGQRIDCISSAVLVPIYCTISGFKSNLISTIHTPESASMEAIILAGYLGKFTGILLPSLYYELSYLDAFALALIMCCKGIVDLSMLNILSDSKIVNNQMYTLAVFTTVVMTGLITPTVAYIYDPSRRYEAKFRRTILNSEENLDLRILVCIHKEDDVQSTISLLEASNPERTAPFCAIVLQLMELSGRATAILAPNQDFRSKSSRGICSEHIVNAFNQFEHHNRGCVMVEHFTAVAPYMSIHDDVCSVALDKKASIIILPFHKKWAIDGEIEASSSSIRILNQNVLKKAPCSVGILIDRSLIKGKNSVFSTGSIYNIAVLFLGGVDDQEALAYSMRMAGSPNVNLTIFRLISERNNNQRNHEEEDSSFMEDILPRTMPVDKVIYEEERVKDGAGTIQVIKKIEGNFDLVLVGRSHKKDNPFTLGFTEWSECPELGLIGDMLASPDFKFSVLVVQQQMNS
ncbi:hypothetical protein L6164_028746 [Bauhinia variegata]|uniref:Uncharacterized protein n=1 Tax=Bauhinia variegata TaxID=167791 RepID=A0ACB9L7S4_BAUVA|nr:hypothetical protein L6164_028746 [Bauhinia variegata]